MQLTREDFQKFLYTYNEDELFYRTLYFEKKEHPETFHKFCLNLDCDLISICSGITKRRLAFLF